MAYRPEIDGLRAVAVLPVLLFHAGLLSGGYLGVDIFFVISGYLITNIMLTEIQSQTFSFAKFYERRARRILPMLLVMMLVALPFAWYLMNWQQLVEFAKSIIAVEFFVSNFWFAHTIDYFAQPTEFVPLLHTWSLGVEEQYYIIWPLILGLILRYSPRYLLHILIVLTLASLGCSQFLSDNYPALNFYLLPSRVWELMSGGILAYLQQQYGRPVNNRFTSFLPVLGLAIILISTYMFSNNNNPNFSTLIPVSGALLIIWFSDDKDLGSKILTNKYLVGIGLISYSVYLWHQPLLAFLRLSNLGKLSLTATFLYIPITLLLSYFSWRFIEKPFQNKQKINRRQLVSSLLLLSIILLIFAATIIPYRGENQRSRVPKTVLDSMKMNPLLKPMQKIGNLHNKHVDFVVYGDSHVRAAWFGIDKAALKSNKLGVAVSLAGCRPLNDFGITEDKRDSCRLQNKQIFDYVRANNIKHVILISKWSTLIYPKMSEASNKFKTHQRLSMFKRVFAQTLKDYKQLGVQVIIMLQVPKQSNFVPFAYQEIYASPVVLQKNNLRKFSLPVAEDYDMQQKIMQIMQPYLTDNTHIYNPHQEFCDQEVCVIGTLDASYYTDFHHLSTKGSEKLEPMFMRVFSEFNK